MLNSKSSTISTDQLSEVFHALADPTRRAMLEILSNKTATVNELAEPFSLSLATISKHLKVLGAAGLVSQNRDAQWRPRRLEPAKLKQVAEWAKHYESLWGEGMEELDGLLQEVQVINKGKLEVKRTPKTLSFSRIFDAPQQLVFQMFESPTYLKKWWAPRMCPLVECDVDFRPGGEWRYSLQYPDGRKIQVRAVYHEIVRPERIVYSDAFVDEHGRPNGELPTGVTTVTFEKLGQKTRLTAKVVYDSTKSVESAEARGMMEGIAETWGTLAQLIAGTKHG